MKAILLAVLLFPVLLSAQKTDRKLETKLRESINGYNGEIGIYVKNLRSGKKKNLLIFQSSLLLKQPRQVHLIF